MNYLERINGVFARKTVYYHLEKATWTLENGKNEYHIAKWRHRVLSLHTNVSVHPAYKWHTPSAVTYIGLMPISWAMCLP